ncbi:hypothetical protein SAMD00019534_107850 [Acytostelium subglobosum LB1]|uniref:hypothetical protein n=1 Tax=Acytostelium subglobosum LB1 TaxID=1410327 RepID=UPI000644B831|nr:hypothetical protein SAMD00019534_107850 [Acytostelium subglobosum LB1]GAM27609.1 hypothetical protein SAMD00019534_107850 [Acytostelium subglobosum LB1]|eukprot:XP_012749268.1 hypothetical protein SAMD00019534_107850 [Acytostelium subglobosum LB1]
MENIIFNSGCSRSGLERCGASASGGIVEQQQSQSQQQQQQPQQPQHQSPQQQQQSQSTMNNNNNNSNSSTMDRNVNITAMTRPETTTTTVVTSTPTAKRKLDDEDKQHDQPTKASKSTHQEAQQQTPTSTSTSSTTTSTTSREKVRQLFQTSGQKKVHRLIDLCFDALVKNIKNIESLEKLPDELCQTLLSIFQRAKILNLDTLNLFKNCRLSKLDFTGKEVQTRDEWLSITKGAMQSTLVSINLSKNLQITNGGLAILSHLKHLTTLDLSYCEGLRGDSLAQLIEHKVPLQKLNLQGCVNIDVDTCLKQLPQFPQLESLNIASIKLSDDNCEPLRRLSKLTQLEISDNVNITHVGIQHICAVRTLRDLDISGCRNISSQGFQALSTLSKLQTLQASDCHIDDAAMAYIGLLTDLKTLVLLNNDFTDDGAAHLSKLVSLTALDLSMCTHLTDRGLQHLKNLNQITRLNLNFNSNLTDMGVATLTGGLNDLATLGIIGCNRLLIKVKHKPLVLLVEDNALQVTLITKIMERHNFDVEVASNGQMALDMYKANPKYELILMDIIMPIMDGLTATMLIRDYEREKGLRRTPLIMQTADTEEGHRKVCLDAGCDDFMQKPLDKKVVDRATELLNFKKSGKAVGPGAVGAGAGAGAGTGTGTCTVNPSNVSNNNNNNNNNNNGAQQHNNQDQSQQHQ